MKRPTTLAGLATVVLTILSAQTRADSGAEVEDFTNVRPRAPKDAIDREILDRPVSKNLMVPKITVPKDPGNLFFQVFDCNAQAPAGNWISGEVTCQNALYNGDMVVKLRYFEGKDATGPVGKGTIHLDASETPDFKKLLGSKEISFADGGLAGFRPYAKPFELKGPAYVSHRFYLRVRDGATTSNVVEYDTSITVQ